MKKNAPLLVIIAIGLVGCAATDISSVSGLGSARRAYSRLLILSTFPDLMYKQAIESAFKQACGQRGIPARVGSEILPPVREYSKEEITEKLAINNIDGLLIVAIQGYWESLGYVPGSSSTQGTASIVGNSIIYSQRQQINPGYTYSKPRVNFDTRLFDAKSGNAVWRSTSLTRGNALADFSTLANSLAGTTVGKLITDRIVTPISAVGSFGAINQAPTPANPQVPITRTGLTAEAAQVRLEEIQGLISTGNLNEAAEQLGIISNLIKAATKLGNKDEYLARTHYLWGVYSAIVDRPAIAVGHFKKALTYNQKFKLEEAGLPRGVIENFNQARAELANEFAKEVAKASAPPAQEIASVIIIGARIRVIKDGATLKVEPNDDSTEIRRLPLGAVLEVDGKEGEWVRIKLPPNSDGIIISGYIHNSFLRVEKE